MKRMKKVGLLFCIAVIGILPLTGCGSKEQKRIVRIGHNQSTSHPTHLALIAFQEYINEHLGDKYIVEVYPNELLGSQTDMVQLTQTGAIDYCVASNAILETFSKNYEIFNFISHCRPGAPSVCKSTVRCSHKKKSRNRYIGCL